MNKKILLELTKIFNYKDYNWFIVGGYNLILHGIEYQTNDIDILCDENTYYAFKTYFKEKKFQIEDCDDPENYLQFKITDDKIKYEIFCELNQNYYKRYLNKKYIDIIDNSVPCLKLIPQAIGYLEVFNNNRGIDPKNPNKAINNTIKILEFL